MCDTCSGDIAPFGAVPGTSCADAGASAGGIVAVILANIVALFLMRLIGKTLD